MPTMDRPVYIAQLKKSLTDYVAGNVIVVTEQKNGPDTYTHISVPYFFLTPLNVTFNRSLQNLSSYYTDIGFIRLLPMLLVMIAVIYSAVTGNRKLLALSLTTLMGWIIWWFIASGIIRYAVGLIAWTIVTIMSLLLTRYDSDEINEKTTMIYILLGVLAFFACIQMICNIFRMASQ
jgi:hypothetical protein